MVHHRALLEILHGYRCSSFLFARVRVRTIPLNSAEMHDSTRFMVTSPCMARAGYLTVDGTYERRQHLSRPTSQRILCVTGERCLVRVDLDNRDPSVQRLKG